MPFRHDSLPPTCPHIPTSPGASITRAFSFITEHGTCRASAKALLTQSHLVKESIMIHTCRAKSPASEAAHLQQTHSPPNGILLCLACFLMGTLPPGRAPKHIETSSNDNSHSNKKQIFTGLPEERQKKPSFSGAVIAQVFAPQQDGMTRSGTWRPLLSCSLACWFLQKPGFYRNWQFYAPQFKNLFMWEKNFKKGLSVGKKKLPLFYPHGNKTKVI